MSVSDEEPLHKMSVLNLLETDIFQRKKLLWLPLVKHRTANMKGLAIQLLFQLVPHAPDSACFISLLVGLKMHLSAGKGHEGTKRFWLPWLSWAGTPPKPSHQGLYFSSAQGFQSFLRRATRVAARSPAPELLCRFPRLPSDVMYALPDACWMTAGSCCCYHPLHSQWVPLFTYCDKPHLHKYFLIWAWTFML